VGTVDGLRAEERTSRNLILIAGMEKKCLPSLSYQDQLLGHPASYLLFFEHFSPGVKTGEKEPQ